MRSAVVDLGSNSVRLVVFEGWVRVPVPVVNEKAVLRLGKGLTATGRLNEEALGQALVVVARFAAIARAMGAAPFEVLATAAVRDARNGPDFVARVEARVPGIRVRVLSGEDEARFSAAGVLCGFPDAEGVLADIGGGSLELVRLGRGQAAARSFRLGVIRLGERSGGDVARARAIVDEELASVDWLPGAAGRDLYLVGGTFRALARMHMAQTGYPLSIVHHYAIGAEVARDFAGLVAGASRRALERMPSVPRRRVEDLPFAAVVLRRLLRVSGAARVVFSANGLREGWYMAHVPEAVRRQDPVLAMGEDVARRLSRDPALPPALIDWTATLFPGETAGQRRLREAACWVSDRGVRDHPEYRAEGAFQRMLRQFDVALDHPARAFLALTLAIRYEADFGGGVSRPGPGAARRRRERARGGAWGGAAACLYAVGRNAAAAGADCRSARGRAGRAGARAGGRRVRWRAGATAAAAARIGPWAGGGDRGAARGGVLGQIVADWIASRSRTARV